MNKQKQSVIWIIQLTLKNINGLELFSFNLPAAEVSVTWRSPLREYSIVASNCTCSRDLIAFSCPSQALVGISMITSPLAFRALNTLKNQHWIKYIQTSLHFMHICTHQSWLDTQLSFLSLPVMCRT